MSWPVRSMSHACRVSSAVVALLLSTTALAALQIARDIDRVEAGLLPVAAENIGVPANIRDRMLAYGVPGVSIAVIDDGKLAWAKGYGVADRTTGRPVTPQTLFQVRMLLNHTAGLSHVDPGGAPFATGDRLPTLLQALRGEPQQLIRAEAPRANSSDAADRRGKNDWTNHDRSDRAFFNSLLGADTGLEVKRSTLVSAARGVGRVVRLPLLGGLMLLEPVVRYVFSLALVQGIIASVAFEISAAGPRFPFFAMLAVSVGFGVALCLYYALIALLSR